MLVSDDYSHHYGKVQITNQPCIIYVQPQFQWVLLSSSDLKSTSGASRRRIGVQALNRLVKNHHHQWMGNHGWEKLEETSGNHVFS